MEDEGNGGDLSPSVPTPSKPVILPTGLRLQGDAKDAPRILSRFDFVQRDGGVRRFLVPGTLPPFLLQPFAMPGEASLRWPMTPGTLC